jgi:hypothetical protein
MRYEVRWCNGYWGLFDTESFARVDTFSLKTYALEACFWANETGSWRLSNWASRWN